MTHEDTAEIVKERAYQGLIRYRKQKVKKEKRSKEQMCVHGAPESLSGEKAGMEIF